MSQQSHHLEESQTTCPLLATKKQEEFIRKVENKISSNRRQIREGLDGLSQSL